VNTGGTIFINGTGTGATATAAVAAGAITVITMTNNGSNYTVAPTISFNGGGFINIVATMNGNDSISTGYTIASGGTGFSSAPTIVVSGGGNSLSFQTTTCTLTTAAKTAGAITMEQYTLQHN
jgi:hypothetical protein